MLLERRPFWAKLLISCSLAGTARAVPFDLIAVASATLNSSGGSTLSFGSWGWIAPAAGSISEADLAAAP